MKTTSPAHFQQHYITTFKSIKILLTVIVSVLLLSSCASSGELAASSTAPSSSSRIAACKINDTLIQNSSQCLQDDAACYQLSNGQWCTGERGAVCPAGSVVLPQGMDCPIGKRCFRISESLDCTIS